MTDQYRVHPVIYRKGLSTKSEVEKPDVGSNSQDIEMAGPKTGGKGRNNNRIAVSNRPEIYSQHDMTA